MPFPSSYPTKKFASIQHYVSSFFLHATQRHAHAGHSEYGTISVVTCNMGCDEFAAAANGIPDGDTYKVYTTFGARPHARVHSARTCLRMRFVHTPPTEVLTSSFH